MIVSPPSLGTRALRPFSPLRQSESGNSRYSNPLDTCSTVSASDNLSPASPITPLTNLHSSDSCKHKLTGINKTPKISNPAPPQHTRHPALHFDGASMLSDIPPIAVQDHAFRDATAGASGTTTASGVHPQPTHLSTTTTFMTAPTGTTLPISPNPGLTHAHTFSTMCSDATPTLPGRAWLVHRRNQRGTWHHRMNKTKCWRCEVEEKTKTKWEKMMHALQYTCLCHYRGYDDDEDPYWRRLSSAFRERQARKKASSVAVPAVARRDTSGLPNRSASGAESDCIIDARW